MFSVSVHRELSANVMKKDWDLKGPLETIYYFSCVLDLIIVIGISTKHFCCIFV